MGPKSKAETVASRKAGAAKMAKAFGTMSRLKITPNQLETYIGRELGVPGAFWGITSGKTDCVMDDENTACVRDEGNQGRNRTEGAWYQRAAADGSVRDAAP